MFSLELSATRSVRSLRTASPGPDLRIRAIGFRDTEHLFRVSFGASGISVLESRACLVVDLFQATQHLIQYIYSSCYITGGTPQSSTANLWRTASKDQDDLTLFFFRFDLISILITTICLPGASATGYTFVPAQDGLSCSGVCSSEGLLSATMREADSSIQTAVCEVNVTGHGRLSGYQEGGSSSCNLVVNSSATNASEYSCLCLQSQVTPGLATANGGSCSAACNQTFDGLTGAAVATDSSETSYACVPSSEIGENLRKLLNS